MNEAPENKMNIEETVLNITENDNKPLLESRISNEGLDNMRLDILQEIKKLKSLKKSFKDKSRIMCCGCFSIGMVMALFVFYIFDAWKYEETCSKTKKNFMEICNAPSLNFWTRFILICSIIILLLLGVYCTGPTFVIFDPENNKISIDKKKLFCLPSIVDYHFSDLVGACLETDNTYDTEAVTTFNFYNVTIIFKNEFANLGLGRDCFYIDDKALLVENINRYLRALDDKDLIV